MTSFRKFDVEISRSVTLDTLSWPSPGDASDESGLGCNREYCDLRRMPWSEAKRALVLEERLLARLASAPDIQEELEKIEEELIEGPEGLYGLDVGVASVVVALSAARCIPFSSCNGGALGDGHHNEQYPLVAFYARPLIAEVILRCAELANVGIHDHGGCLVAYADSVEGMIHFARELTSARSTFRKVRLRKPKSSTKLEVDPLPGLFDD